MVFSATQRLALEGIVDYVVDAPDGPVGVVDRWERGADGLATSMVVAQGRYRRRRVGIPIESVLEVDHDRRRIVVAHGSAPLAPRGFLQRLLDLAPVDSAERVGAPFARGERVPPVLCGVADDSQARAVVAVAARLAAGLSAPLVLTHVTPAAVPPGVSAAAAGPRRLRDLEARDADALLDELLSQTERGVGAGRVVTTGEPAPTLEELAAREGAQLLVIGSAGKGALGALVKGSVSHHAIGHAPCPVVVVPPHVTDWPPPRPAGSSIGSARTARPPVETRPSSSPTGPVRARTSVS